MGVHPKTRSWGRGGPLLQEKLGETGETGRRGAWVLLGTSPASARGFSWHREQAARAGRQHQQLELLKDGKAKAEQPYLLIQNILSWEKPTRIKPNCWPCTGQPQECQQVLPGINLRQEEQGEQEAQQGNVSLRAPSVRETRLSVSNCINRNTFPWEGWSIKGDSALEQMFVESSKAQPGAGAQSTENAARTDPALLINLFCCNKDVKQLQCHWYANGGENKHRYKSET